MLVFVSNSNTSTNSSAGNYLLVYLPDNILEIAVAVLVSGSIV